MKAIRVKVVASPNYGSPILALAPLPVGGGYTLGLQLRAAGFKEGDEALVIPASCTTAADFAAAHCLTDEDPARPE